MSITAFPQPLLAPGADTDVFERARRGEEAAFTELYGRHVRYVAGVVVRILGRDAEVDDIVQETFCDALAGLKSVADPAALRGWLVTIAVRRTKRAIGKRIRRRMLSALFGQLAPTHSDPGARSDLDDLYDALDRIPIDLRIVWVLARVEDLRLEDVATACEISLATVKRRLRDADDRLARRLES